MLELAGESLVDLMYGEGAEEARLRETRFTQPAIFAVEYALVRLWASWGVKPDIVCGHSIGEYAAACAAGVLELPDAMRLVVARGRLMQTLPAAGAMAAILTTEEPVAEAIAGYADVAIAAINAEREIVISGPVEDVSRIAEHFRAGDVTVRELEVSQAFHSPLMRPMVAEFTGIAEQATYHPARLPMVSTVTGRRAVTGDLASASYWSRQVESTVHFAAAAATLAADGVTVFLEIGAAPILSALARAAAGDSAPASLDHSSATRRIGRGSLRRSRRCTPPGWTSTGPASIVRGRSAKSTSRDIRSSGKSFYLEPLVDAGAASTPRLPGLAAPISDTNWNRPACPRAPRCTRRCSRPTTPPSCASTRFSTASSRRRRRMFRWRSRRPGRWRAAMN